jgi:hypothetical protein
VTIAAALTAARAVAPTAVVAAIAALLQNWQEICKTTPHYRYYVAMYACAKTTIRVSRCPIEIIYRE